MNLRPLAVVAACLILSACGAHPAREAIRSSSAREAGQAQARSFLEVLARVTPHLPVEVRLLRFAVAKDLVNRVLGQPAGQVHRWIESASPGADAEMAGSLVDIVVGIFAAEVH